MVVRLSGNKNTKPIPSFVENKIMSEFSGITEDVQSIVARGLTQTENYDRSGRLWASDSAFCPRQAVLNSTLKHSDIRDASSDFYFSLGNTIEDRILTGLDREKKLLYAQYRLPDFGLNMGGKIDAIAYVNKRIRILEIKSCGELPSSPKPYQESQALLYSAVLGLKSSLVYFSRSVADFKHSLKMRQFDLDPSGEDCKRALFYAAYSHYANQMGVLPNIPYSITNKSQCGFCRFTQSCFGDMALPNTIPMVTPAQDIELVDRTNAYVADFMSKVNVTNRRSEMLQTLIDNGTDAAKELLTFNTWADLW